jgi:hypothetical protein
MKKLLMLLFVVSWLVSCRKECHHTHNTLSGSYAGTFKRWMDKDLLTTNIQITFSGNLFIGSSDSVNHPSICNGAFEIIGNSDSINFVNSCVFPASFDPSYILNGSYKFIQKGDSIYFRRLYGDLFYGEDVYNLRKQ